LCLPEIVETPVRAVDEAVVGRLRLAIDVEAGGEEEQLKGVLRMLAAIGGGESPAMASLMARTRK